ncbi:MAG TPA: arginine--tRNA ligase [Fimbriimonas sp.]
MLRDELQRLVEASVGRLVDSGRLPDSALEVPVEISDTKTLDHGDYACNFALAATKRVGVPPRQIGEMLRETLGDGRWAMEPDAPEHPLDAVEVAGPGFVNLRLNPKYVAGFVGRVLERGTELSRPDGRTASTPQKINIEFVSVNPNGPITIGSGRGAAFGSTLANVLEAAGNEVHREYYINDGVNSEQMRLFAESVMALAEGRDVPEKGYKGEYVADVAKVVRESKELLRADLSQVPINRLLPDPEFPAKGHQALNLPKWLQWLVPQGPKWDDWQEPILRLWMVILDQARGFGHSRVLIRSKSPETGTGGSSGSFDVLYGEASAEVKALTVPGNLWEPLRQLATERFEAITIDGWRIYALRPREAKVGPAYEHLVALSEGENQFEVRLLPLSFALRSPGSEPIRMLSEAMMIARQRGDLGIFGVEFDTWFSEQSLHDRGEVARRIQELAEKGVADEEAYRTVLKLGKGGKIDSVERVDQPNEEVDDEFGTDAADSQPPAANTSTLWLRSTKFGDDMDRVLRRKDGRLTYIASDVAYHADKFNRPPNADKLITILGPDHHGYIGRLHAVLAALLESPHAPHPAPGTPLDEVESAIFRSPEERDACRAAQAEAEDRLEVVIFQIVRFLKDGKPAPMRKRDGNIYELRDLVNELGQKMAPNADRAEQQRIGRDVSRFFYLTRSHDTHLDFDIDLATKQSDENPVFYAQYAHARICSVLARAQDSGLLPVEEDPDRLQLRKALQASSLETGGPVPDIGRLPARFVPDASTPQRLRALTHPRETALIKKILDLPMEVARCAEDYGVHRLTTYAVELARSYHHFYDACRVIQPDQPDLTQARLALCEATKVALKATFDLLGVSAPEKMERAEAGS